MSADNEWQDHGFSASEGVAWRGVGVWDPDVAQAFRTLGIEPETVQNAGERLARHANDPIGKLCRGEIRFLRFLSACACAW